MRILSWNVHGLHDDPGVLARIVRDLDPDVMCVQEAPKYFRWRARCAEFARRCRLLYVTGGGTTGGTALLASLRVDVRRSAEVALSRQWFWPDRGVAAAVVERAGTRLNVASVHLPLEPAQRLAQAHRVVDVQRGLGQSSTSPALAAGDLNERPGHAAWQAFHDAGLRDLGPGTGPTFPAAAPDRRIDGVLATEQVELVDYQVLDVPGVAQASDHRPVLVDVRVPRD